MGEFLARDLDADDFAVMTDPELTKTQSPQGIFAFFHDG